MELVEVCILCAVVMFVESVSSSAESKFYLL